MDDFEQLLKNQPLRAVPPEWRREILAGAANTRVPKVEPTWLHAWLWPSPYAWGALAAVWVAILGLNLASRPIGSHEATHGHVPTRQEIFALLVERRRELEEISTDVTTASPAIPPPASSGTSLNRRRLAATQLV